ncbi:inorganic pyrophosphatase [Aspergillus pseudoustus]|uniref:inorganic diphosphatase n=1 Tax=Aspergillus pseudoustus TaxID=1810923 RepID=A0ABR4KDP1_9EURO
MRCGGRPLFADGQQETVNVVVEIPRKSHAKMEISKDDQHNHIKQDVAKGKPRVIVDVPLFQGYPCNCGAIPQASSSEVRQVKPLGALAVLDEGKTDWKLSDIQGNEAFLPGYLGSPMTWYKQYKHPEGKPANEICLGERLKDSGHRFAVEPMERRHSEWDRARRGYPG